MELENVSTSLILKLHQALSDFLVVRKSDDLNRKTIDGSRTISEKLMEYIDSSAMIEKHSGVITTDDVTIYAFKISIDKIALSWETLSLSSIGEEACKTKDLGRFYCTLWLHQQFIRYSFNDQNLLTESFYAPFIYFSIRQLNLASLDADVVGGSKISLQVVGPSGCVWTFDKLDLKWHLTHGFDHNAHSVIYLDQQMTWLLFAGKIKLEESRQYFQILGNQSLGLMLIKCLTRLHS